MNEVKHLLDALDKHPKTREADDSKVIASYLRNLDCLREYSDSEIEALSYIVQLLRCDAGETIYE